MWKNIKGYSSAYQINKKGQIRHFLKRGFYPGKWVKMNPSKNIYGYQVVELYRKPIVIQKLVHRLVIETFLGPFPEGKCTNHKNGIRHDNRLSNLEFVTPKENAIHGVKRRKKLINRKWKRGEKKL